MKRVTIVGLARSGMAAARLLRRYDYNVRVTDLDITGNLRATHGEDIKRYGIEAEFGRHTREFVRGSDMLILSPGVPDSAPPIVWAIEEGMPVLSEIELAFRFCPAPIVAITGTNGKTTVATLIGEVLKEAGLRAVVCGNIGNPFSGELYNLTNEHIVVLEVSSFQLAWIDTFKPKVSLFLNLSQNHLDRHPNYEAYFRAKSRIVENQDQGDWAVINGEDSYARRLGETCPARKVYFDRKGNPNFNAVRECAQLFNVEGPHIDAVLDNFKGIEHRLEEVAVIKNVRYVNDSKSTTIASGIWAFNRIKEDIILIAGGRDKNIDFKEFAPYARRAKCIILIGESRGKLGAALKGATKVEYRESLEEAVKAASSYARLGDCVLFSPLCTSFDMFEDYAARGRAFKEAVGRLRQ